jgi:hypothetical protein
MAAYNNNNENMVHFNINENANNNAHIAKDAKNVLDLIVSEYRHIDMTEEEKKAMLYLLSSMLIEMPLGQEESMTSYQAERKELLEKAKDEIEEAIEHRKKMYEEGRSYFGGRVMRKRMRTIRKRSHKSKTRRNRNRK